MGSDQCSLVLDPMPSFRGRAKLCDADLNGANLEEAFLGGADLRGANLEKSDLSDADLREADLTSASLPMANLSRANLLNANLFDAILLGANLSHANLQEADLRNAVLNEARLTGANVDNARLAWADFYGAVYAPTSSPPNGQLEGLRGVSTLTVPFEQITGLVQLRTLLERAGLRDLEREATFAIESNRARHARCDFDTSHDEEKWDWALCRQETTILRQLGGWLRLIFFEWTTGYGLYPSRALV